MIKDPFARLGLDREVLTVSQLNGRARVLLEDVFSNIWVEGEISNLARPASGHVYFTLKDSGAQVRCALFRQNAARVRQALKDGLAVKVRGKVSLFEGRGDYQLILDTVEPAGDGALRLAFDALKEKLSAEGLFSADALRVCRQRHLALGTEQAFGAELFLQRIEGQTQRAVTGRLHGVDDQLIVATAFEQRNLAAHLDRQAILQRLTHTRSVLAK